MDKKELNDLIDRIGLTGPGGTDKIKKILKELANGSGGSGCDCPGAMFVHGTIQTGGKTTLFVPNSGEPSSSDAMKHIENGGILYIVVSPAGGIELTVPLAYIQTMNGATGLGFMMMGDSVVWIYEPEPDFSIRIDFNNPNIGETDELLKIWFTQLDESTVGGAETCELLIDNYSRYSDATLSKQTDGLFVYSETSRNWALALREIALSENPSLAIPETVKYVVVYQATVS